MILFQDVLTNDTVLSDAHPFTLEYNGAIMKVKSKFAPKLSLQRLAGFQITNIAGTADPEVGEEELIDIEYQYNLTPIVFENIEEYTMLAKEWLPNMKTYLQANVSEEKSRLFQRSVQDFVIFLKTRFSDFTFYVGTSEQKNGAIIHSYWENDEDEGPTFLFYKDALREVKA